MPVIEAGDTVTIVKNKLCGCKTNSIGFTFVADNVADKVVSCKQCGKEFERLPMVYNKDKNGWVHASRLFIFTKLSDEERNENKGLFDVSKGQKK